MIINYILSKLAWSAVVAADVALAGAAGASHCSFTGVNWTPCCPGVGGHCDDVPTAELLLV